MKSIINTVTSGTLALAIAVTPLSTIAAPVVRTIKQSQASGTTAKLQTINVWNGHGVAISFYEIGETIKKVWLDDPSQILLDTDGCLEGLDQNCPNPGAGLIHLRRIKRVNIPGLPQTSTTLLTVITQSSTGERKAWDNLPGLRTLDLSFVAKVDLPLRDIEANRTRSISGSYQEGFNVPCLQNNCAHMEMSGIGKTTGTQWISGKFQKVNGGFGLLKTLNRGKEPTGRNPFGSSFKQVVWNIDEASGEVETAMFFRICKRIPFIGRTCSPYFIGPVPFIEYREKDPIVLGQPNSLP
ncbi:hypothetical protein [Dendronalium phyllosphericum]|uniref:hypothetical protein n=1 Tax=Dendronalium phyllosphericum TaxID=2840445 RepID=UPI001CEC06E8|nr:hypothetical protein [Dendronalium phyllosphericum]